MKKKPTQVDVAHRANVSQSTVSQVLNNPELTTIPEETKNKIHQAVMDLGYVPDKTAISLRTKRNFTIAVIIPDISNPFYPAFERGIQRVAEMKSYDVIVYNTDGILEKEEKNIYSATQGHVDGIIYSQFNLDAQALSQVGLPVVMLGQKQPPVATLDILYVDNEKAAKTAVEYLIQKNHRRIGMIAGVEHTPPREKRLNGYKKALIENGINVDEALIKGGDFTEIGGYSAMQELLKITPIPSAVFCANDLMAFGAMQAIREKGLTIPTDIALVGFDDIPACKFVYPQLTTINQFAGEIGACLADMLIERIESSSEIPGRVREMPFQLTIRASV